MATIFLYFLYDFYLHFFFATATVGWMWCEKEFPFAFLFCFGLLHEISLLHASGAHDINYTSHFCIAQKTTAQMHS